MDRRGRIISRVFVLLACIVLWATAEGGNVFDVVDFGAKCGSVCTKAIQQALDAAEAAGGGIVVVPKGTWITGTIWMRSHTELHLKKGAILCGSTCEADYNANDVFPENFHSVGEEWSGGHLVLAYKVKDVAITGDGVIDGSGPAFFGECDEDSRFPGYKYGLKLHPIDRNWFRPGPMLAMFLVKGIRIEGVTLRNAPSWTSHFRCCDGLVVHNVKIDTDRTIANSDGFSIDCTRNVIVSGCTIKSGDDGFAIRASCRYHAVTNFCESIQISDCDVWSCCYGIRFGVGSGTIRNVVVKDCRFHESNEGLGFTPAWVADSKNVYITDVRVSNCVIDECAWPVKVLCPSADACVKNILIENCLMSSLKPNLLLGNEICKPENFIFRNCSRRLLPKLRVRHHRGWEGTRNRTFATVRGPSDGIRFENCLPDDSTRGVLVLAFYGCNFADWAKDISIFDKYDAHATFFASGEMDDEAIMVLKKLSEGGHTIGLYGLNPLNFDESTRARDITKYFTEEVAPRLDRCRVAYIPISSFAYSNGRETEELDDFFQAKDFRHVCSGLKNQNEHEPIYTDDRAFFPASQLGNRFTLNAVIVDEAYPIDINVILASVRRCAERNEVFTIIFHSSSAKHNHLKTELLGRILATAKKYGIAVLGLDDF